MYKSNSAVQLCVSCVCVRTVRNESLLGMTRIALVGVKANPDLTTGGVRFVDN